MSSALFLAKAVHTSSVSHSQFDKHLIMPQISRLHPLWVAVMPPPPKKIHSFCGQWPLCPWADIITIIPFSRLLSEVSLHHVIGSFSQATSEDINAWYATSRASLSNSEAHFEDIGRTVHIYFSSANKMSRPNEQLKH